MVGKQRAPRIMLHELFAPDRPIDLWINHLEDNVLELILRCKEEGSIIKVGGPTGQVIIRKIIIIMIMTEKLKE